MSADAEAEHQAEPAPAPDRAPVARRRRARMVIGGALLAVGIGAAAIAIIGRGDDGSRQRPVGKLTSSEPASDATTATGATDDGTTTSAAADGEAVSSWPAIVKGRPGPLGLDGAAPPAELPELDPGYYLFNDFNGWHLWAVGDVGDSSAEVVLDADFPRVDQVGGEPDLEVDRNSFRLARGGADEPVVGVDFSSGFYGTTMVVTITGDAPLRVGTSARTVRSPLGLQLNTANG
ncbi:MAG: hypothetical protein KDB21_10365 [Acidimicrobiales bacterium]|nr:hypothetical protein [Acidimicrobiales bacterium]